MFIRSVELSFLSLFGGCGLLAAIQTAPQTALLQFGALGLVGFMVMQNARQRKELHTSIDKNQDRYAALVTRETEAKHRLCDLLGDRPCLLNDSRISQEPKT